LQLPSFSQINLADSQFACDQIEGKKKKEHLILLGLKKKEDGYAQGERGRRKRERERKRKKQKGKDH